MFPFIIRVMEILLIHIFSLWCLKSLDWHMNESPASVCLSVPVCLSLLCLSHTCLIHISMEISATLQRRDEYFSSPRPPNSKDFYRYKDGNSSASSTLRREILKRLSKAWTCSFFGTSSSVWWSNRCNNESPNSTLCIKCAWKTPLSACVNTRGWGTRNNSHHSHFAVVTNCLTIIVKYFSVTFHWIAPHLRIFLWSAG